jgi:hypothetical protein
VKIYRKPKKLLIKLLMMKQLLLLELKQMPKQKNLKMRLIDRLNWLEMQRKKSKNELIKLKEMLRLQLKNLLMNKLDLQLKEKKRD